MMKYKKNLLIGLIFSNIFFCVGQQSAPDEYVSIYEIGEPVTNCDININNLLKNWIPEKIANANEYEFLDRSFVETISDSSRYVYYRNYFSSDEPVYSSVKRKGGYSYPQGIKYDSLWVYPGFLHSEYHDTRGLPDKAREILSEDFRLKAMDILSKKINIDTMQLFYYSSFQTETITGTDGERTDTIRMIMGAGGRVSAGGSVNFGVAEANTSSWRTTAYDIATVDSLSNNYIDVYITHKKKPDDLSIEELRELLLEELLIERILKQLDFNRRVAIGDKVFLIKFKHKESSILNYKEYNDYIICNSETNKVVMDYFFGGINLKKYKN